MRTRLRAIFFIAFFTAMGILAFQIYWVNQAYTLNRNSFFQIANVTLQRSIDSYFLKNMPARPGQPNDQGPPISFITTRNDTPLSAPSSRVDFGTANLHSLQVIMAQALFQLSNRPFQIDSLRRIYGADLAKEGIHLPFTLSLKDSMAHPVKGVATINGKDRVITADFLDTPAWIWKKTLLASLISFLLVLLTASCLWYMLRIIWKQRQIDDLKNEFIDNVTHELKTPIAVLRSTHEALLNFGEVGDKEKTIRYLNLNARELDQMQRKVDRLLDITRLESGVETLDLDWVNLSALLDNLSQQYAVSRAKLTISYNLPGVFVWSNEHALADMLSNLTDNAIKYGRSDGAEVRITIGVLLSGWALQIEDNGIGIARSHLPYIFDKFYRVPSGNLQTVRGYGIGLSYVADLVKQLKGRIETESELGKGTRFNIIFPESGIR